MSQLNPDELYEDYRKGELSGDNLIKRLDIFYNSKRGSIIDLAEINNSGDLKPSWVKIYRVLEKIYLFESDPILRKRSRDMIFEKNLKLGTKRGDWFLEENYSPDILLEVYLRLKSDNDPFSRNFLREMEKKLGRSFAEKYNLISREALALWILERKLVELEHNICRDEYNFIGLEVKKGKVETLRVDPLIYPEIDWRFFSLFSNLKELILCGAFLNDYSELENLITLKVKANDGSVLLSFDDLYGIEKLSNLRVLDLSNNEIEKITRLEKLKNLKYLNLEGNIIKKLSGVERLINLEYLNMNFNDIEKIENLDSLWKLKHLHLLNNNKIKKIEGLGALTNLETLNLSENVLINEIEGLDSLKSLKRLELRSISSTDSPMINLPMLKIKLNKDGPHQTEQRESIVPKMDLYSKKNDLKEIKGLANSENLEELDLRYNRIEEIKGLETLKNLRILKLDYNNISEIKGLENLDKLEFLSISHNPLGKYRDIFNLGDEFMGVPSPQKFVEYCKKNK